MYIRTGTRIIVDSAVNGRFSAVAAGDFDTDKDERYPITTLETVKNIVRTWSPGERVPCMRGISRITVIENGF